MPFNEHFFEDACSHVRRTGSLFSCTFLARRAIANGMLDEAIAFLKETQRKDIRWHSKPFPGFEEQKRLELLRLSQILEQNQRAIQKALRKLDGVSIVREMKTWQIPHTSSEDAAGNVILEEEKMALYNS
jgi:hypothetical protein